MVTTQSFLTASVVVLGLVSRVYAQCSSVVAAGQEQNLTALLAGIDSLEGNPNAFLVNSVIQSEKESAAKFTIFAPNDAAFAATFPGGIDDGDVFFDVLGAAVLTGEWTAGKLIKEVQASGADKEIRKSSLNGKTIVFTQSNNNTLWVRLSDQSITPTARVVVANVASCAGTLHVINRVLIPDEDLPGGGEAPSPGGLRGSPPPDEPSILTPLDPPAVDAPVPVGLDLPTNTTGCVSVSAAASAASLPGVVALIENVEADPSAVVISTALSAEAPLSSQFTVFAPVDDAVRSGVNSNTSSSEQAQVLSNHMVSGVYSYDDLLEGASDAGFLGLVLQTVNGEDLKLTTDGFNLWVVPEGSDPSIAPASILRRDVETCAGIMHVVDSLLAPPGMKIAESPLSTPNPVDIPRSFKENPTEGEAMAPGEAAEVEFGEDASSASRRQPLQPQFPLVAIAVALISLSVSLI